MWDIKEVPKVYLMALCAWREARGCAPEAIRGVLHVIHNRAKKPSWWGAGIVEVILKPKQFSSFNAEDPNAVKFPDAADHRFGQILDQVQAVLLNQDHDLTGGATHYHNADQPAAWSAAMVQTAHIGPFLFYK